jgi:monoamine oxidase
MTKGEASPMRRRDLLSLIGAAGGSSALLLAMTRLGHAQQSDYAGPIKLPGDAKGTSVLILGAGLAGMVAALELRQAGYHVQVLEYNGRVGGRTWTIRGGDRFTELGGATQDCGFDRGLYLNPGPWRIPYHHRALLDYCKRLGVKLEPFIQDNANAYLHGKNAFGGEPQRYRAIQADFNGAIADMLAKAVNADSLNALVSEEDAEVLLAALQDWGALDKNYAYKAGPYASERRGWQKPPGGGLSAEPIDSTPLRPADVLQSHLWRRLSAGLDYDYQTTLFQPVGGMDMIAQAFAREVGDLVRLSARVSKIAQDANGVQVTWEDTLSKTTQQSRADWCLCTIPLSVLSQIEIDVCAPMAAAIAAVPYSPSVKIGLQFNRRFWETDEAIYGGISYTDLPINMIGYPATGYFDSGKGVLLGAYAFGTYAFELESLSPSERIEKALAFGAQIHPQYRAEFDNGMAVAWHRVPSNLGCYGQWSEEARSRHYRNLCAIDGRILLAGEHASYIPAWQEGAVLSSLDAITRLHERVVKS